MNLFKSKGVLIALLLSLILTLGIGGFVKFKGKEVVENIGKEVQPVIELKTSEVVIETGDEFDAKKYIVTATDEHGNNMKDRIATVDLDTSQEGTYDIVFEYSIDGFKPVKKTLKVTVETPEK